MNTQNNLVQDELVDECFGCPQCGERRVDLLLWMDDENVECDNCHHEYNPLENVSQA